MPSTNDLGIGTKVVATRNNGQVFKARVVALFRSGRILSSAQVQWARMDGNDNHDLEPEEIPISNIATILSEDAYTAFMDIYEVSKRQQLTVETAKGRGFPAPKAPTAGPVPPEPLYAVDREQLARDWKQWIESSRAVVDAYRNHFDAWEKDEEGECEADIAEIQREIKELEIEIIQRKKDKDATIREAKMRSKEWLNEKERAIKDALQTVADVEVMPAISAPFLEEEHEIRPDNAPRNLCCPITLDLMTDPVIAMDGHTYERSAIEQVFQTEKPVSPCTNLPLQNRTLISNVAMRSMCLSWREKESSEE